MTRQSRSLIEVLAEVEDFRQPQGKRYSLVSILALACTAMMCGYRSYGAMSEWGRHYGREVSQALGFKGSTPCAATFHNVFRELDKEQLEGKLGEWAAGVLETTPRGESELEGISIDGKTLRGSRRQGAGEVHLLSVVSHRLGVTLGERAVPDKTNEITQVPEVLKELVLKGWVVTGDALLTQRTIAETIVEGGGDYVLIAKGNQPELMADIRTVFEEAAPPGATLPVAETLEVGHGRIEQRRLTASSILAAYSYFPGLAQVFTITREVIEKKTGLSRQEVVFGLTSLTAPKASPAQLLTLVRGHWTIENKSHWVRDVTFDEDRSQVRCGSLPQVLAALRNTAIGLMRWAGETKIAAACRKFAAQPWSALALIGINAEN